MVNLPAEDAITDALLIELEELRNEALPGDPLLELNIVFAGQQPRRTQSRIGPDALTTDIRAHVPGQRHLDMRIEAKVLFTRTDLTRELLGPRGMLRFGDRDDPYSDTLVGGMLSYVVAPCGADWDQTLEVALRNVPDAIGVERVTIAGADRMVCDLLHSADQRRVTVFQMNQRHQTSPTSWIASGF